MSIFTLVFFLCCVCCCASTPDRLVVSRSGDLRINHQGIGIIWYFGNDNPIITGDRKACTITFNGNTAFIKIGNTFEYTHKFK